MKEINPKQLKTYLIGSIENCADGGVGAKWRRELTPMLEELDIFVFDPVKLEKDKTNKSSSELKEYVKGLARSGRWTEYKKITDRIWYGVDCVRDDGKPFHIMGDRDYVWHSDFLIWYLREGDRPLGSVKEATWSCDMNKPVYLVTEINKSDLSGSLCHMLLDSGLTEEEIQGFTTVFKNFNQLTEFLKEKYNL